MHRIDPELVHITVHRTAFWPTLYLLQVLSLLSDLFVSFRTFALLLHTAPCTAISLVVPLLCCLRSLCRSALHACSLAASPFLAYGRRMFPRSAPPLQIREL